MENRISQTPVINDYLIKETLRSKDDLNNPVCRTINSGGNGFTFASVIMTLTGNPYMQITKGSPDETEYKKIEFSTK